MYQLKESKLQTRRAITHLGLRTTIRKRRRKANTITHYKVWTSSRYSRQMVTISFCFSMSTST